MTPLNKILASLALSMLSISAFGQLDEARLFWDIPHFYLTAPDVTEIDQQVGAGLETAFNFAAHWGTLRAGAGANLTLNPTSDDIRSTLLTTPYFLFEAGAGMYRTNGNKCAKHDRAAFTAMGVIGLRYDIDNRDLVIPGTEAEPFGLNWVVGAEFGWFLIRDIFRNTEIVLRGTYYPEAQVISGSLGFKFFLNCRAFGDRY